MAVFNEELKLLIYEFREDRVRSTMLIRLEAARILMLLLAVLAFLLPLIAAIESTANSIALNIQAVHDSFGGA